jgi:hypothetical protein
MSNLRIVFFIFVLLFIVGCASIDAPELATRLGEAVPTEFSQLAIANRSTNTPASLPSLTPTYVSVHTSNQTTVAPSITPASFDVNITSPQDGSAVSSPVDMSFNVVGTIREGFNPVVLVRDPIGQYWGWLHVQNLGDGNWFLPRVALGNEEDCGKSFELHVVITNETVAVGQSTNLPNGVSHSVTVTKQCGSTPPPSSLSVNISSPQDGSAVFSPVDVSFTVTGTIPEGFNPVVLVGDPLGQFWSWLHVQDQGNGKWFLSRVTLGNEEDCGKSFELHVVITNETVPVGQPTNLPNGVAHNITVTKECGTRTPEPPLSVNITSPQNGSSVTSPVNMEFTVDGDIPEGFSPVGVVRDPLGQYWGWLQVVDRGGGSWFLPGIILGNDNDCGKTFELHIVITNELVSPSKIPGLPGGERHSISVIKVCNGEVPPTPTDAPTIPLSVNITSPQNGSSVTSPVNVKFSVTGDIPEGFSPVVLVRDPLGQYWGWLHVQNLGDGNWLLPGLALGNASDCGKSFELHVVITNETVPVGQPTSLPNDVAHNVTVTKQCAETPTHTPTPSPTYTPSSTPTHTPTNTPVPLNVNITSPRNGSNISSSVDVSFEVSGDIPSESKPIVFVRDPLGQFWPWFHIQNQGGGNWFLPDVTLGNENDCSKSFELHVVITAENVSNGPHSALPNGIKDGVVVTKTC